MIRLNIEVAGDLSQRAEHFEFFRRHRRYDVIKVKAIVQIVIAFECWIEDGYRAFDDGTIFKQIHVIAVDLLHSFARFRARPFARYALAVRSLWTMEVEAIIVKTDAKALTKAIDPTSLHTFLLGGQLLTQAPLSFNRCSGQFFTQVAPYAYLPFGFVSQAYVIGLYRCMGGHSCVHTPSS